MKIWVQWLLAIPHLLFALPKGGVVRAGEAGFFSQTPSELSIQTSDRAILEWADFSIREGEKTSFIQPHSHAAVLNRVVGNVPSSIFGQLESNGRVYLINPQGVIFGKDAVINTAGFFAFTFDCCNEEFLHRGEVLFQGDSIEPIVQMGTLKAPQGNILLFAHRVENEGKIEAKRVSLGAGHEVVFQLEEERLLYVRPSLPADGVCNKGVIKAIEAEIVSSSNPYALGIQQEGIIEAIFLEKEGGKIFLRVEEGNLALGEGSVLRAPLGAIAVKAEGGSITNDGILSAFEGEVQIGAGRPFYNQGCVDVGGNKGGSISIAALKCANSGVFSAKGEKLGGAVHIAVEGPYIEVQSGQIDCSGALRGGRIDIEARSYFSSGTVRADGARGGVIAIDAEEIVIAAAHLSAGSISLKGLAHVNPHSTLEPSSFEKTSLRASFPSPSCICTPYEFTDPNPSGTSSTFGDEVVALSTGNVVITKPSDDFAASNAGAVYLYNGANGSLISILRGSNVSDSVGSGGVFALTNGNYVISSPLWRNGGASSAGAATWCSGTTGLSGSVSASNSLVGSIASDRVSGGFTFLSSRGGILALPNGNYVVGSPLCRIGAIVGAGAATWGNGLGGTVGAVSAANSLVGAALADRISLGRNDGIAEDRGLVALSNENYVVTSPFWGSGGGATTGRGAATWGNGLGGTVGAVSAANSLVGGSSGDRVALANLFNLGAVALNTGSSGHFVVASPLWNNGGVGSAGAVTWCDGSGGTVGLVSAANSLVGSVASDFVGDRLIALTNGHYVTSSGFCDIGGVSNAGAATWGNGLVGGTVGAVTAANSLVGSSSGDLVGDTPPFALSNGHYVVLSPSWDDGGTANVGAATWGDGGGGTVGAITAANSLVGSSLNDSVGFHGIALTNGNFVIGSPSWTSSVGAVTWCDGLGGTVGAVSAANSLVGTTPNDRVGDPGDGAGLLALPNGNYVVASSQWDGLRGAVTWGDGSGGTVGAVSAANSLVGSTAGDQIGSIFSADLGVHTMSVHALTNNNYLVRSPDWDNGGVDSAGAATWGDGSGGTVGAVSAANSLVGSTASDAVGSGDPAILSNGDFVVFSPSWDNGATADAGAVTLGSGTNGDYCGAYGSVTTSNSVVGGSASSGLSFRAVDTVNEAFLFQFTNDEGQTRVFAAYWDPCPVVVPVSPPPVVIPPALRAQGSYEFLTALSESFQRWDRTPQTASFWAENFPPYQTPKGLSTPLPFLGEEENYTIYQN